MKLRRYELGKHCWTNDGDSAISAAILIADNSSTACVASKQICICLQGPIASELESSRRTSNPLCVFFFVFYIPTM